MKCAAFDIGDRWVGIAIADALGITCRPYETVTLDNIEPAICKLITQEMVTTFIVGYPRTMSGTESEQTKKVVALKEHLAATFTEHLGSPLQWVLWDERLSSKRAQTLQKDTKKGTQSHSEHAVAAAYILQSYLDNQAFIRQAA